MTPFIIYALPRSRTAWLSAFLSYGLWECRHETITDFTDLRGLGRLLATPWTGICETSLSFAAPALRVLAPGYKAVVIQRNIGKIKASMAQHGVTLPDSFYAGEVTKLNRIVATPGTLTLTCEQLDTEEGCRILFEHCLGQPFDRDWWLGLKDQNIQIPFLASVKRGADHASTIYAMMKEAKQIAGEPTIQEETWGTFMRDARQCIAEHIAEVCKPDEETPDPDYELGEALAKMGRLQITTARVQGEVVGYIVCIINRDMEHKTTIRATQIPFFVRKEYRGYTGLRLHAAMRKGAWEKGARKLTMRSGIRGVGAKQDALFRRLGAKEDGHMFTLNLEAA